MRSMCLHYMARNHKNVIYYWLCIYLFKLLAEKKKGYLHMNDSSSGLENSKII